MNPRSEAIVKTSFLSDFFWMIHLVKAVNSIYLSLLSSKNHPMKLNLKKRVIYQISHKLQELENEDLSNKTIISETLYSEDGTPIEEIGYDIYGNIEQRSILRIENGLRLQSTFEDVAMETKEDRFYEYNDRQQVIKMIHRFDDGSTTETIFTYDDKGQLIREVLVDNDEDSTITKQFIRDSDQNLKIITTNENEEVIAEEIYEFNEQQNITSHIENSDGQQSEKALFYDEMGRVIVEKQVIDGRLVAKLSKEYTENGYSEKREDIHGIYLTNVELDQKGREIFNERKLLNGKLLDSQRHEYDENDQICSTTSMKYDPQTDTIASYSLLYSYEYY